MVYEYRTRGTCSRAIRFTLEDGKVSAVSFDGGCNGNLKGIAALTGLDFVEVEGATGELETNYQGKVQSALDSLKLPGHDFVAIHLEAPDECTHNGDLPGKLQAIEWLDSRIIAPVVNALKETGEDYRILILSDHKTLTSTRGHDGEPVPFILYDSREQECSGYDYSEENGLKGPMVSAGTALMGLLFEEDKG